VKQTNSLLLGDSILLEKCMSFIISTYMRYVSSCSVLCSWQKHLQVQINYDYNTNSTSYYNK